MKTKIFTIALSIMLLLTVFCQAKSIVDVTINTVSKSENVKSNFTVEEWGKNAKLISISFTNNGKQTEFIKNIAVKLKNAQKFGEK